MFKLIALIKRNPKLTREEFIEYYEKHHAPLGASLFGLAEGVYRRNYVRPAPYFAGGDPGVDVITEVVFPDQASLDTFMAKQSDEALVSQNAADAKNYRDDNLRAFFVDVYES